MADIKNIAVVGAGMMGAEIALCFALKGYPVLMKETSLELAQEGKERQTAVLDKSIKKGKLDAGEKDVILARVTPTDSYGDFSDADLVIEAVFEDKEVKTGVFGQLDKACKPECIFATNTSSLSITLLATTVSLERRSRFLGAHFFSPATIMKLVEVIPGLETEAGIVDQVVDICREIGKEPIRVKDVTGFVVNRILHAMWIEANRLLEEGVATPEDIDLGCKMGLGHPIGPYALMDLTANDLNLSIQKILFEAHGERFRPRPILKQKVDAGHLGRKTGRGWYDYTKK